MTTMKGKRRTHGTQAQENGHADNQAQGANAYRSKADRVRAEIAEMEEVNKLIGGIMSGPGSHEEKVGRIHDGLAERGYSDSQIADIMEPKEAQGGRHFMGHAFSAINAKKSFLKTLEVLERGKSAAPGGFVAREQARREQAAGEGQGQGASPA
jgi:hypothetical protein